MSSHRISSFALAAVVVLAVPAVAQTNPPSMVVTKSPAFIANAGQWSPDILFKANGPNQSLIITADGFAIDYVLPAADRTAKNETHIQARMHFTNLDASVPVVPQGERPERYNFLVGSDPTGWRTDVPAYDSLIVKTVWPGVDVHYYFDGETPRFDFDASPGADTAQIGFLVDGDWGLSVVGADEVDLQASVGAIRIGGLAAYTQSSRAHVDAHFVTSDHHIAISVPNPPADGLVIDPFIAASWVGSYSGLGGAYGIALDSAASPVVVGETDNAGLAYGSVYQSTFGGSSDGFIAKYGPSLSEQFFTYLGGSSYDQIRSVNLDSSNSIYVTGETCSSDFPTINRNSYACNCHWLNGRQYCTWCFYGVQQPNYNGGCDAFVTKMNAAGSVVTWSTYLGGDSADQGNGIRVDSSGNTVVVGQTDNFTSATPFPTTPSAYQGAPSNWITPWYSAFLSVIDSNGSGLTYSTLLNSATQDSPGSFSNNNSAATAVDVDNTGNAVLVGWTDTWTFPTKSPHNPPPLPSPPPFMSTRPTINPQATTRTGFAAKIAYTQSNESSLVFSTYLGGGPGVVYDGGNGGAAFYVYADGGIRDADDYLTSIRLDGDGSAVIGGYTSGTYTKLTRKMTWGVGMIQSQYGGGASDGVLFKLRGDGADLLYGTHLGGWGTDAISDLTLDTSGNVFLTGWTTSGDFPLVGTDKLSRVSGDDDSYDAFVAEVSYDGTVLQYSHTLSGTTTDSTETASGIARDPATGNLYVFGSTDGSSLQLRDGGQLSGGSAGKNMFLAEDAPTPIDRGLTWSGDFTGKTNLNDWNEVLCGGFVQSWQVCPVTTHANDDGGLSPDIRTAEYATDINACPYADKNECRFMLAEPELSSGTGYSHLRFRTEQEDQFEQYSDRRNELGGAQENGSPPLFANDYSHFAKEFYGEGDERYYYFEFFADPYTMSQPIDENACSGADGGNPNCWHLIFQFHSVGECAPPAQPLQLSFSNNADGYYPDGGVGPGNEFHFELASVTNYDAPNGPDYTTWQELWPLSPKVETDHWYHFVFHVRWSSSTAGLVDVWMQKDDGTTVKEVSYVGPTDVQWDKSCYDRNFPTDGGAPDCICNFTGTPEYFVPHAAGDTIPVFFKSGLYRNHNIRDPENVYLGGYKVGLSCGDVWPNHMGASPCP